MSFSEQAMHQLILTYARIPISCEVLSANLNLSLASVKAAVKSLIQSKELICVQTNPLRVRTRLYVIDEAPSPASNQASPVIRPVPSASSSLPPVTAAFVQPQPPPQPQQPSPSPSPLLDVNVAMARAMFENAPNAYVGPVAIAKHVHSLIYDIGIGAAPHAITVEALGETCFSTSALVQALHFLHQIGVLVPAGLAGSYYLK